MVGKRKIWTILLIFCISILMYLMAFRIASNRKTRVKVTEVQYDKEEVERNLNSSETKLILIYTKIFGLNRWRRYPQEGVGHFKGPGKNCSVSQCELTYNRSRVLESHIVIFNVGVDLPTPDAMKAIPRSPLQKWVLFTMESPFNSRHILGYDYIFNWTATYKLDSDIYTPYFHVKKLSPNKNKPRYQQNKDYAKSKNRLIMAAISNCGHLRLDLVKSLQQFIDVDVYGKCKSYLAMHHRTLEICPRFSKSCDELKSKYKFFIAFENSYCSDYITEKFYAQALQSGLVPIVLNRGKLNDTSIAPPNSFINVLDYPNMQELAIHLKYLDSNDTAYNEYHKWRSDYEVEEYNDTCALCRIAWSIKTNERQSINITEKWNADRQCISYESDVFKSYIVAYVNMNQSSNWKIWFLLLTMVILFTLYVLRSEHLKGRNFDANFYALYGKRA